MAGCRRIRECAERSPPELGQLAALEHLRLDQNRFTGPLPLALAGLHLDLFSFGVTDLSEPGDSAFGSWLAAVPSLQRTGVACGTAWVLGLVWVDRDGDGWPDSGEPGIADLAVTLRPRAVDPGAGVTGRQVFTGPDGWYRFEYLPFVDR